MRVEVEKLTDQSLLVKACEFTSGKAVKNPDGILSRIYRSEHSPMRTQMFWVELYDIPTFVSVHLVRHSQGVTHFVQSNRDDIVEHSEKPDRDTPVNHAMLMNAQALINMARKRLCNKAHPKTREVMGLIREGVRMVDPELAHFMVRECEYRNGCHEQKSCGFRENVHLSIPSAALPREDVLYDQNRSNNAGL